MKSLLAVALLGVAAPAVGQAAELRLKDVVAEVRIVPEARGDFAVSVANQHPRLPQIRVSRTPAGVVVDGGLYKRIRSCGMMGGVQVKDGPRVSKRDMPVITVRAPLSLSVNSTGYVRGDVGPARALKLDVEGCGRWDIADVADRLDVAVEGFANVNAGRTRTANLSLEGLGDIDVASVNGPLKTSVEGLGHIRVKGGRATAMTARLEGLGGIRFDGVADTLDASAEGMGSIRVPNARRVVNKRVDGLARIKTSN